MIKLAASDPHHWAPVPQVVTWLAERLPDDAKVLEIGPGHARFARASKFVDFVDLPGVPADDMIKCDLAREPLPFPDKSFDFIYCRHVLEDMFNPFPLCEEMSRVAHAGYIETPSPVAEMCRGVDGNAPVYRGYHHHRFMVWNDSGELRFVSKYPLVEYLQFNETSLTYALQCGPKYWNTHYLWTDRIRMRHMQSPLDYDIPRDYQGLIANAFTRSMVSSDLFWMKMSAVRASSRAA